MTREIDVVEEVARIHGLEHVPATLPAGARTGGLSVGQLLRRRLHEALLGAGCNEVQTMSLAPADMGERLGLAADDPRRTPVLLANPLSAEHAAMRTLLHAEPRRGRGAEPGARAAGARDLRDRPSLRARRRRGAAARAVDARRRCVAGGSFFAAKGILQTVFRSIGLELAVEPGAGRDPFLHPGRAARIVVGGAQAGYVGELHPTLADRFGVAGTVAVFEVDVSLLEEHLPGPVIAVAVPDTPPLRQDIAVVVADEHLAADVVREALAAGGDLLRDVQVFDVYRDAAALGEGRRSLALRLTFQADDRTLTDDEVAPLRASVVEALARRFGAELRG